MHLCGLAKSLGIWGAAAGLVADLTIVTLACPPGTPIVCGSAEMCESMLRDASCDEPCDVPALPLSRLRFVTLPRDASVRILFASSCSGSPCEELLAELAAEPGSHCDRSADAESPCGSRCGGNCDEADPQDENDDGQRSPKRCPDSVPACCLVLNVVRAPIVPDSSRDPGEVLRAFARRPAFDIADLSVAPSAVSWRTAPVRGSPANSRRAQLGVWLN